MDKDENTWQEAKGPGRAPGADAGTVFKNSDERLKAEAARVKQERKKNGMNGLVGGLQALVINVQPNNLASAAEELLGFTGMELGSAWEDGNGAACRFCASRGPDILLTARKGGENPFRPWNIRPRSKHLPDTRLETFIFEVKDIDRYVELQKARGVRFLTDGPVACDGGLFVQTRPSGFTGNSLGFVQWTKKKGSYADRDANYVSPGLEKPDRPYLKYIHEIDHTATRVHSKDRDAAIIEFMELTEYDFEFAIYVQAFNSITNVARLTKDGYAAVFTSGISPYAGDRGSGPTERFTHNFGPRVHHMAFATERIEDAFEGLKHDGMGFLIDLVGSKEEGLKQTFSKHSKRTLIVNEYIQRYGGFDGFFTKSNVTLLTGVTDKQ